MLSKCNSNDEIKRDSWFDVLMGRRWFFLDAWCRQLCTVVWYFPHVEIRSSLAMTSFEVSIFPLFTEESFQASSSQRLFGRRGRRNFRGAFWSSYFMMSVSWSFRKIATFLCWDHQALDDLGQRNRFMIRQSTSTSVSTLSASTVARITERCVCQARGHQFCRPVEGYS